MNTNPTPENIATYIAEMAKRGYPTFTPEDVQHAIEEFNDTMRCDDAHAASETTPRDSEFNIFVESVNAAMAGNASTVRTGIIAGDAEPMVMHRLTIASDYDENALEYHVIAARPVDSFDPADYRWYIEAPAALFAFLTNRLEYIEDCALADRTGVPVMVKDLLLYEAAQDDIFEDTEETPTT